MRTTYHERLILLITLCFGLLTQLAHATEPEKPIRIVQENLAELGPADQEHALEVACRLETIATMDRTTLTRTERKALRSEVRELKREVRVLNQRGSGTVIYISAATIIIILLVLLLVT